MLLLMLALPGSVYLYQGEELGLAEVEDLPDESIQDPVWTSSGHTMRGRDGCRVPIPWSGAEPPFGFSAGQPWLPQPAGWRDATAEAQSTAHDSVLQFYRTALALRRDLLEGADPDVRWADTPADVLAFDRGAGLRCVLNLSGDAVGIPGVLLLASGPVTGDELPPDTAAWLRVP
jgi:alpha-glucosidase